MTDIEHRLWRLELRFDAMPIATIETRLAAAEQLAWQAQQSITSALSEQRVRLAQTGGGGIAAASTSGGVRTAGSGTVTIYDIDNSTGVVTSDTTVTAFNGFPVAVGASKWIYVARQLNSDGSELWVVPSESCT